MNRLAELSVMKRENGTLRVGALTRHRQVEISAEARAGVPGVVTGSGGGEDLLRRLAADPNTGILWAAARQRL